GDFTGGAFVAAGDLNGDGRAEWVVTPDQGGGPNTVIYSLNADGSLAAPKAFFALGNPAFRGGARPAVGDVNGDGTPDLATGAGRGCWYSTASCCRPGTWPGRTPRRWPTSSSATGPTAAGCGSPSRTRTPTAGRMSWSGPARGWRAGCGSTPGSRSPRPASRRR